MRMTGGRRNAGARTAKGDDAMTASHPYPILRAEG